MNRAYTYHATTRCDNCERECSALPILTVLTADTPGYFVTFKQFCCDACCKQYIEDLNNVYPPAVGHFRYEVVEMNHAPHA